MADSVGRLKAAPLDAAQPAQGFRIRTYVTYLHHNISRMMREAGHDIGIDRPEMVEGRNVDEVLKTIAKNPRKYRNVVGFMFYDRAEVEMDGRILVGEHENFSGWIYLAERVQVMTADEVARSRIANDAQIHDRMIKQGAARVVVISGETYLFRETDSVVQIPFFEAARK